MSEWKLVLASASPRRNDLLREAGYTFDIAPANVDEQNVPPGLSPAGLAEYLAAKKADRVAVLFPEAVVLAADTVVAAGNQILGKPADPDDARHMLQTLSGTTHSVITAVAIVRVRPAFARRSCVASSVHMRPLSPAEIDGYVAAGDWQGKAGGYGIQDPDPFVTRVSGCHTNIVGLPMTTTRALLAEAGIVPRAG